MKCSLLFKTNNPVDVVWSVKAFGIEEERGSNKIHNGIALWEMEELDTLHSGLKVRTSQPLLLQF